MAGPVLASPAFIFAFVSYKLCKKGYKKMAWVAPLGALLIMMLLAMGV
jgi:hypothetical protein